MCLLRGNAHAQCTSRALPNWPQSLQEDIRGTVRPSYDADIMTGRDYSQELNERDALLICLVGEEFCYLSGGVVEEREVGHPRTGEVDRSALRTRKQQRQERRRQQFL